jgi:intracellular septation protein
MTFEVIIMNAFLEFLPIIIFYAVYKMADIYMATAALIISMILLCIINKLIHKKIKPMLLFSTLLVLVLGSITLFLRDPVFIQWKPTLISFVFASLLLGSTFIGKITIIERLFSSIYQLPKKIWLYLTFFWTFHFITLGITNYLVFTNLSESTWVNFKLFGSLAWAILFIIIQTLYLAKLGILNNDRK